MSLSDPLGDMLTRIRNGQMARLVSVDCPASHFRGHILDVLTREGYIRGFSSHEIASGVQVFTIELKYHEGEGAIRRIRRVSRPGRRVYSGANALDRVFNGLGVSVLSTPQGVLSDREAREKNVGGEVLCQVF